METLHGDPALKQAGVLAKDGGKTTIKFHALDISQENSIREFRDVLRKEHPEGIDAVVNNAGKNHQRVLPIHGEMKPLTHILQVLRCKASTSTLCAKR